MNKENIKKLTPHQDINDLLVDWTEGIRHILGTNEVGLYLSGSLAYGDFVPGRSDIDLYVVLSQMLNENEIKRVGLYIQI